MKKPKKRSRLPGHSFRDNTAVVVMRGTGQVLNQVTILEKAFDVDTPDLGVLSIPTPRIKTIVYKNLPSYPTDMLRTINGAEFNGVVLNDPVWMRSPDLGGTLAVQRAKILSIIW